MDTEVTRCCDLHARTQHPEDDLGEYVRAIEELFLSGNPGAPETVLAHVLRRCRPRDQTYLFSRSLSALEELAHFARQFAEPVLRKHYYAPPPPADVPPERACSSPTTSASRHHDHLVNFFTIRGTPSVRAMGLDDAAAK
ncbi:hypothetical protein MTO96_046878 [Rhipicephalus appendiculatus]